MKKISCFIALAVFLFYSCTKQAAITDQSGAENSPAKVINEYIIKKGNHYCDQNQLQLLLDSAVRMRVKFDSSAIYTSIERANQEDVNKLTGFSDCGTDHQQNSARIGWSWNGSQVVLYAYAYVNRLRYIKTLGEVNINQSFSCSIRAMNNNYYFEADGHTDSIPRFCAGDINYRYRLFPYFGGDESAPHEIHISMTEE